MKDKEIKTLIKILKHKKREDLADLLIGSCSEVDESSSYGSLWHSVISSFLIFSPLEKYYKLRELSQEDYEFLLDSVLDIYPHIEEAPEIVSIQFRLLVEDDDPLAAFLISSQNNTMRIFLSYSSYDKELCGRIKRELELYGFEVFLAHDDINPTEEWREIILQNLEGTDIFLPVLTQSFKTSRWTDQECGIAIARNKFIISVSIEDNDPYGFLSKYQSLKFRTDIIQHSCKEIVKAIREDERFKKRLLDLLVVTLCNSNSFEQTSRTLDFILDFKDISEDQVKSIAQASAKNSQIYNFFYIKEKLKPIFDKSSGLDQKIISEFEAKLENKTIT